MTEPTRTATGGDGGVRSIQRALDLLSLFDRQHSSRSLRELMVETGLPKTTVVRLLATLESRALVSRRDETTYLPGPGFLRWVRMASALWELSQDNRTVLRALVDSCGETANVYVRQELTRISIAQEEGTATVRSVVEVGSAMPLSRGATARVLLSGAPGDVLDRLAEQDPSIDASSLERQVSAIRETGYAVSHGERELGASAVAAPVLGQDGRVIAALSVSGPTSRFTAERVHRYVEQVVASAATLTDQGLGNVEALL